MENSKTKHKIIYIDDEHECFDLFSITFKKWFDVTCFEKGEEAIKAIKKQDYDAIITDYEMPDINGLELLKKIKENIPDMPVIFYTGQGNEEIAREAFILGASDYFIKGFFEFAYKEKIVNSIKKSIEKRNTEKEKRKSEIKYRTIFESTSNASLISEEDTTISLVNSSFENLTGYSKAEIEGKISWTKIIHKDDLDKMLGYHVLRRIKQGLAPRNYEFRLIDCNKTAKDIYVTVAMIPGTSQSIFSLLDITQRKKTERELKDSEERLRAIFNASEKIGFILLSFEGKDEKILEFSPGAQKLFDCPKEIVFNYPIKKLHFLEDIIYLKEIFQLEKYKNRIYSLELPLKNKSGKEFYGSVTLYPILDASEKLKGILYVITDITKTKEIEKNLIEQISELNNFAQRVAHNLKGPINNIKNYAKEIKNNPKLFDNYFNKIIKNSDSLINFINNLLKLSKAGKTIGEKKKINLENLIQDIFESYKSKEFNMELHIYSPLEIITGDPQSLNEIFSNLIYNSIKYRDQNKEKILIEVKTYKENSNVIIIFKDNGIGIKQEYIKEIFKPGFALNKEKGTGFGLSITKNIIEYHKGEIWANSNGENLGTEFFIKMPILKSKA